jgi:hypothetical protein
MTHSVEPRGSRSHPTGDRVESLRQRSELGGDAADFVSNFPQFIERSDTLGFWGVRLEGQYVRATATPCLHPTAFLEQPYRLTRSPHRHTVRAHEVPQRRQPLPYLVVTPVDRRLKKVRQSATSSTFSHVIGRFVAHVKSVPGTALARSVDN